jgi:hypothetical protein
LGIDDSKTRVMIIFSNYQGATPLVATLLSGQWTLISEPRRLRL